MVNPAKIDAAVVASSCLSWMSPLTEFSVTSAVSATVVSFGLEVMIKSEPELVVPVSAGRRTEVRFAFPVIVSAS